MVRTVWIPPLDKRATLKRSKLILSFSASIVKDYLTGLFHQWHNCCRNGKKCTLCVQLCKYGCVQLSSAIILLVCVLLFRPGWHIYIIVIFEHLFMVLTYFISSYLWPTANIRKWILVWTVQLTYNSYYNYLFNN